MSTLIAGRYELERRLGIGGMSTVQLAFDRRLERHVAVKLLAEHLADDPAFVSRFRREALSAARLVHPNIVQVFDFGFDEAAHQHFIVMERVDGRSGAEILRERGHLDVEEAVDIVSQACRGLDYAHRNGVVHRDVKPGNLLRANDGVVKLADFGIAKATEQSSITQVGSVLGTAAYLAPETARGDDAGPQSDIYSLGVVAYQLLSGRLPYEATSLSELALRQQREAPIALEDLNPSVPETLAQAVELALALEPEGRPHDAAGFERALRAGARGLDPIGPADPTTHLPAGAAATRVLDRSQPVTNGTHEFEPTSATHALPRRQPPPQVPARRPAPRVAAPPRTGRQAAAAARAGAASGSGTSTRSGGGSRAMRRVFALLVVCALIAAGIVVAVVATSTTRKAIHLRNVVGNDVQQVVQQAHDLIQENTR